MQCRIMLSSCISYLLPKRVSSFFIPTSICSSPKCLQFRYSQEFLQFPYSRKRLQFRFSQKCVQFRYYQKCLQFVYFQRCLQFSELMGLLARMCEDEEAASADGSPREDVIVADCGIL